MAISRRPGVQGAVQDYCLHQPGEYIGDRGVVQQNTKDIRVGENCRNPGGGRARHRLVWRKWRE